LPFARAALYLRCSCKKPLLVLFQETFAFASKAKGHKGTRAQGQQGPLCVFLFKFKFKTKNKNEIITMTMEAKAVPQK